MVKVEFFENTNLELLKTEVNHYLKTNNLRMDQIGKIYYNKVLTHHSNYDSENDKFSYSVMIVIDNWRENTTTVPEGSIAPIPDGGIEGL